jgi:hypothetical protein
LLLETGMRRRPLLVIPFATLLACGSGTVGGASSDSGPGAADAGPGMRESGPPDGGSPEAGRDAVAADVVDAKESGTADAAPTPSHRPAGLTTLFDYDFSAPLPNVTGGNTSGLLSSPPVYYMYDDTVEPSRYPGAWTKVTDPTAPAGSTSVLAMSWPTGLWASGSAQEPGSVALGTSGTTTYSKYYLAIWSKLVSTTGAGGTGFELTYDGPGIKSLGYLSVGDPANPPRGLYFLLLDPAAPNGASNGVSAGPFAFELGAQIGNAISYNRGQGYGGAGADSTASTAPLIPIDTWVLYEFYFQLDTMTAGESNSDGWFQCWLNGTLAFDYRNMQYRNSSYAAGFYQWDGDFVWGGESASAKMRTDYQYFARATAAGQ